MSIYVHHSYHYNFILNSLTVGALSLSSIRLVLCNGLVRLLEATAVGNDVLGVNLGTVYHYILNQRPSPQISHSALFHVVCERNSSRRWQYLIQTI